MILHSIVPVQAMQQMFADASSAAVPSTPSQNRVLSLSPTSMVEGTAEGGQFTVSRILSTDPNDYILLSPGRNLPIPATQSGITFPHFL